MEIADIQRQAAECFNQGQYQDAIALYEQCVDVDPDILANYWYLGLAWLFVGEASEAQAVWLAAIMAGTAEQVEAWTADLQTTLLAEAQRQTQGGKRQHAIQIYEQLLELDAESAETHHTLGNLLSQQGALDAAIASWQRATDLNPELIEAYQSQAEIFQRLEQYEEAIDCHLHVFEAKPTRLHTAYNLGLCLAHQNRLNEAIAYFERAAQLDPNFTPVYGDWGMALLLQGNVDDAVVYLNRSISLRSGLVQTYLGWANSLEHQGMLDCSVQANADLLTAILTQPKSAETYFLLGNFLTNNGYRTIAIATYTKALELQPDAAEIYLKLGRLHTAQGNFDQAISAHKKAIEFAPKLADAYLELGKCLAKQGDFDQAISNYQQALENDSTLADAYFYWGEGLSAQGDWNAAIAYYQQALKLHPTLVNAYFRLGIALAETKQSAAAIACFQTVMKLVPELAKTVYDIATVLQHQGLSQDAIDSQKWMPVESPNGFYESTQDWAIASCLEASNYFGIYPVSNIDLTLPKTLDQSVDIRFRFGDRLELPASFVVTIPNGRLWIQEQSKTAVITEENKILGDVSPDFPILSPGHPDKHPSKHSIFGLGQLPPAQEVGETVAVFSGLFNDAYFHWMFDVLPRIELLHRSEVNVEEIDYFLVNTALPFQKETLAYLEIPQNKCLEPKDYPHIQAKNLVVPSFPASISWMPKWTCDFLRRLFLSEEAIATSNKIERLYISRNQTTNRRIINEAEIIDILQQFGFTHVVLESLSVVEQAALLAHATVVIAPHGGGLTNIVFCNPGTKVIELFSPNYVYPCYWLVSNLVKLEYHYLLGEIPLGYYLNQFLHPNPRTEDIFINVDKLLELMKFAGIIKPFV